MSKKQIAIGLSRACGIPFPEQLDMLKKIGFDGFFATWSPSLNVRELAQKAAQLQQQLPALTFPQA